MNIAQKIIEAHKLKFASLPPLQQCSVSGSALFNADCMNILPLIPDKSVQLILADLPYGTTQNKWDSIIPLEPLWKEYKRIISNTGNIVLFASQPFTSALISSNYGDFKYCWTWDKVFPSGFLNCKKQPLRRIEDICVFSYKNAIYNPQFEERTKEEIKIFKAKQSCNGVGTKNYNEYALIKTQNPDKKYPTNLIIKNSKEAECNFKNRLHPTQKPLEIIKYLIRTYTNEKDMVLDNTMGVGTTCLGAKELNRKFIGIEKEVKYYELAVARVFGQHCH